MDMLVPEEERRLSLLVFQKPSAAADWMLAPGASKKIPSVPASVGPYAEEPQRPSLTDFVVALTATTFRPFAGSSTPSPLLPGAMSASDHGITLA